MQISSTDVPGSTMSRASLALGMTLRNSPLEHRMLLTAQQWLPVDRKYLAKQWHPKALMAGIDHWKAEREVSHQIAMNGMGTGEGPLQDVEVHALILCDAGVGAQAKINQYLYSLRSR